MRELITKPMTQEDWLAKWAPDYKPADQDFDAAIMDAMDIGLHPAPETVPFDSPNGEEHVSWIEASVAQKLRFIRKNIPEETRREVAEAIPESLEMCRMCKRNCERRDVEWPPCRNIRLNKEFHYDLLEAQGALDDLDEDEKWKVRKAMDPVVWAESEFSFYDPDIGQKKAWSARWYQRFLLRCSNKDKTAMWGRRTGKSEGAIVDSLHHAEFRPGDASPDRLYGIHIFVHAEALKEKHFAEFTRFLENSKTMKANFKDQKKDHLIRFKNSSEISFNVLSLKSGLGQSGKFIWFDEAAFYAEREAVIGHALGLRLEDPDVEVLMTSNSSGFRGKFYHHSLKPETTMVQLPSYVNPRWNVEMELTARDEFTEEEYVLLVLAEWGESSSAVFAPHHLEACQQIWDYSRESCRPEKRSGCFRVLGCDWNEGLNGVHFVVVEFDPALQHHGKPVFKMIHKSIITGDEWSHEAARKEAFDIIVGWQCDAAYLDWGGGGSISVPDLKRMLARANMNSMAQKVVAINMSDTLEVPDPLNPEMNWRMRQKNLIVRLAQLCVQQHRTAWPSEEFQDTSPKLRRSNVVPQAREFKVERVDRKGQAVYSTDQEEHTLTAWLLALYGCIVNCTDMLVVRHHYHAEHIASNQELPSAQKKPLGQKENQSIHAEGAPIAVARNKSFNSPYQSGMKSIGLGHRTRGLGGGRGRL